MHHCVYLTFYSVFNCFCHRFHPCLCLCLCYRYTTLCLSLSPFRPLCLCLCHRLYLSVSVSVSVSVLDPCHSLSQLCIPDLHFFLLFMSICIRFLLYFFSSFKGQFAPSLTAVLQIDDTLMGDCYSINTFAFGQERGAKKPTPIRSEYIFSSKSFENQSKN